MTHQTQPTIRRGSKVVLIDHETRKRKISELTVDEARAMAADMNARVADLRRRWEASGDLQALFGALIFYRQRLPEWLFKGLTRNFEQQFENADASRFRAVRYAHDLLGMPMDESYDWAADNVGPSGRGRRDTMMKSYQKIASMLPEQADDRIRRRSRK